MLLCNFFSSRVNKFLFNKPQHCIHFLFTMKILLKIDDTVHLFGTVLVTGTARLVSTIRCKGRHSLILLALEESLLHYKEDGYIEFLMFRTCDICETLIKCRFCYSIDFFDISILSNIEELQYTKKF